MRSLRVLSAGNSAKHKADVTLPIPVTDCQILSLRFQSDGC